MRRGPISIILCLSIIAVHAQVNINAPWTWVNGEKHIPMRPVAGAKGIPALTNIPGGRKEAVSWKDRDGKFWVFGGYGYGGNYESYLNDLWTYDPITNQWAWINGDYSVNVAGVYGTQGIPVAANKPGSRRGSVSWVDSDGNFWLYGGEGFGAVGFGRLSDIWKYNPQTGQWTWMNGPTGVNALGIYGSLGVSEAANLPGARNGGTVWVDNASNIWMFGGEGYGKLPALGRLSDLWKYSPATNQWTWVNGADTIKAKTTVNYPGSRRTDNTGWKDNDGNFYLFGGVDGPLIYSPTASNYSGTYLNELWKYNPLANNWTLINTGGTIPGMRSAALSWISSDGKFWIYGGHNGADYFSDLYKFDPVTNVWTMIKSDTPDDNYFGVYGIQGVASVTNKQGDKGGAVNWVDATGKVWSFGGDLYTGSVRAYYNDLWQYDPATNLETWIKGDSSSAVRPIYGSIGVADAANRPGERRGSGGWTDNNGNLWLFGGNSEQLADVPFETVLGDLWKYNIAAGQWTWIKGLNSQTGTYGTKGVAAPGNLPGSRENPTTWTEGNNLWLFGGRRFFGGYNDLWKYDITSGMWTWMHGGNTSIPVAVYGTQGVANSANTPGPRQSAANWQDNVGNFWMFGGYINEGGQQFNDLWKYNVATNQWTWVSGDNIPGQPGNYGIKGVPASTNKPGCRRNGSAAWKDNAGNLWVFGGYTAIGSVYFNDLWKFDVVTNQWTWIHGDNTGNTQGIYGTKGTADAANTPGARYRGVSWTDAMGNFWLMGGQGYDAAGNLGELNDLWMFSALTSKWTWVKGDDIINNSGVYGTKNIPNVSNKPGARYGAAAFKDGVGDLWLYGGFGFGESGEDRLSDLWKISSPALSSLPVRLLEFKGRLVNDNGLLNWKTENEVNLASYIVERSIDRKNYMPVGTVTANNSNGSHLYSFTDPNIALLGASVIYYRLKQKDLDGKSTYSNIVALTIDKSLLVMMYPNPVTQTSNVTITINRIETVNVKVINGAGAVVKQLQWKLTSGSTSNSIDLSELAKGAYYLDISGETISKKIGFVKQ